MLSDTYRTIHVPTKETLYKEKASKFFGYAFPVLSEDDVKDCLEVLKKKHHSARHFCYAYQLGVSEIRFRANDDGEPNNSAGIPIHGQIQSFQLTNILVVCVRYFGGVKLGVGGLISAYKISAKITLEASNVIEKTINTFFIITFNYNLMNTVMRIIREKKIQIVRQQLEMNCEYEISVRKKDSETVFNIFKNLYQVEIKMK